MIKLETVEQLHAWIEELGPKWERTYNRAKEWKRVMKSKSYPSASYGVTIPVPANAPQQMHDEIINTLEDLKSRYRKASWHATQKDNGDMAYNVHVDFIFNL